VKGGSDGHNNILWTNRDYIHTQARPATPGVANSTANADRFEAGTLPNGVIPKPRVFASGARDLARITTERWLINVAPVLSQVMPMRIQGLDEGDLLAPSPAFNLFFAVDCWVRIEKALVLNETGQIVQAGETPDVFVLVLPDAACQVASDTGV
jgi:hypothetical protein